MYDAVSDLRKTHRFIGLRTKFVLFISLVIVAVCSSLSWYFIEQRREFMTDSLTNTGHILAENLAYNSRNAVILEDQVSLSRLIDGVLEVEEVVYVVMTGADGKILAARSKGVLSEEKELSRSPSIALYPDPSLAKSVLKSDSRESVVTVFRTVSGKTREIHTHDSKGRTFTIPVKTDNGEMIYDFAIPVIRRSLSMPLAPPLSLESNPGEVSVAGISNNVYGVVELGLTSAKMQRVLASIIENVVLITTLIILAGIGVSVLLAGRI
ncbi:MAG TPA: hypothetical protein VGJ57_04775, partial [Nitrospirales bacterium]